MKTIALSMIFSLAVILCEQQTLFAALSVYTNVASVTADSEEGHRGIPIAGVNRLIPLAGRGGTSYPNRIGGTSGPGGTTFLTGGSASLEHGPGMHDSLEPIRDTDHQDQCDHIHGDEDQPFTHPYWDDSSDSYSHQYPYDVSVPGPEW